MVLTGYIETRTTKTYGYDMKIPFLNMTFHGMVKVSTVVLASNVFLAAATLFLLHDKLTSEPLVRVIPAGLTTEAVIGSSSADAEYLMSHGMYVANLTGNITPRNVTFVADVLGSLVDPSIYSEVRRQLFSLAENPIFKERGGSLFFEVQDVSVDLPTGKVFVLGNQVVEKTSGRPSRFPYVYEIQIEMRHGRPWVVSFDKYEGRVEHSLMWEKKNAKHIQQQKRREAKTNSESTGSGTPWFEDRIIFGADDGSEGFVEESEIVGENE